MIHLIYIALYPYIYVHGALQKHIQIIYTHYAVLKVPKINTWKDVWNVLTINISII